MKVKKLLPLDDESRRLLDWMEKGVYDALQKKYLKTLLFCIYESADGPMIEEYTFSFSCSNSESQEVSMNINRSGTKKGGTSNCNSSSEITPTQMRSSACKMVQTLIQLMRTLDKMPEERTVLMKLMYYDDVTVEMVKEYALILPSFLLQKSISLPMDYEPPFFRDCTEEEAYHPWNRSPLKMEVGKINSKYLVLALKVKSVLDPCEDENKDHDNAVNLSDELQLRLVKDISSFHLDSTELTEKPTEVKKPSNMPNGPESQQTRKYNGECKYCKKIIEGSLENLLDHQRLCKKKKKKKKNPANVPGAAPE